MSARSVYDAAAERRAIEYERVLEDAISYGSALVISFCKKHIYPRYKKELAPARRKENATIKQIFDR